MRASRVFVCAPTGWNDFEGAYNMSPRQLHFCAEIAEKAPALLPLWQWRDNEGHWKNYEAENTALLEDSRNSGTNK